MSNLFAETARIYLRRKYGKFIQKCSTYYMKHLLQLVELSSQKSINAYRSLFLFTFIVFLR